jgi:hypothetical protein
VVPAWPAPIWQPPLSLELAGAAEPPVPLPAAPLAAPVVPPVPLALGAPTDGGSEAPPAAPVVPCAVPRGAPALSLLPALKPRFE